MGRPPLDRKAAGKVSACLIQATQELIVAEGLESVTIRKIAQKSDLNSATLYRHFEDLDELLLFACVDLFKCYVSDLIQSGKRNSLSTPLDIYMVSWELFCRYAFQYSEGINHLFFSKHSHRLGHVVRAYYDLFPEQLEGMSGSLQTMVRTSNLYQRNMDVLRPLIQESASADQLQLINDLTVSYFRMLLNEKIDCKDEIDNDAQTKRMLHVCKLLLTLCAS